MIGKLFLAEMGEKPIILKRKKVKLDQAVFKNTLYKN